MKKIYADIPRIGDSICALPLLKYLADTNGSITYGPHLNKWITPHLPDNFVFDPNLSEKDSDYTVGSQKAWDTVVHCGHNNMHMIEGYFISQGIKSSIDYSFPFPREEVDTKVDIVISPYGSSTIGNKLWQFEKWLELIDSLPSNFTKAIIGADTDNFSWISNRKDVKIVSGKSLPYIANLLDKCKLFISIDTGTSHLAHVLGIKNHVLLYAHHCAIVENLLARKYNVSICKEWYYVENIPVPPVKEMCFKALKDFGHI
jgi:Glycosyltransferase family 9 (heptosyltransferase)